MWNLLRVNLHYKHSSIMYLHTYWFKVCLQLHTHALIPLFNLNCFQLSYFPPKKMCKSLILHSCKTSLSPPPLSLFFLHFSYRLQDPWWVRLYLNAPNSSLSFYAIRFPLWPPALYRNHGLSALSRVWQHIKLSGASLGARPRYMA